MLTNKEVMLLGDYLKQEQSSAESMSNLANTLTDTQCKQLFQQLAQKDMQNAQTLSKHLNAGQNF